MDSNVTGTLDCSVTNSDTNRKIGFAKDPEYICPVHGEIKNRTMVIKDCDNDLDLANCRIHCLAELINENIPKIELKNG